MKAIRIIMVFCLFVPLCVIARAELLFLPENLTEISSNAFAGDESITEVVLGKDVTAIGEGAFSGCINLKRVVVNNHGSAAVGAAAFPEGVAFYAANDAIASFKEQGGYFKGFQALLVGQTYPGDPDGELLGCDKDAETMADLLGVLKLTEYKPVTQQVNKSWADAQAELKRLAESASEKSTTLFYYSGHGNSGGKLVFDDIVEPGELRVLLDDIPGQKIVLIDACNSGGMIGRGEGESAEQFVESFLSAFTSGISSRSGNAFENDGGEYAVLVACNGTQLSNTLRYTYGDGDYFGLFTGTLECAAGETGRMAEWYTSFPETMVKNMYHPEAMPGDKDGDGLLTLAEAYGYVYNSVDLFCQTWNDGAEPYEVIEQTVQVWPDNSNFVLFGR
ncbi:MAG: caspase family protein [Clostridiales bacterium]|nr:caspase family protein [Clostridiales bacterium]